MGNIPKRTYGYKMTKAEMRIELDVILDDETLHIKTSINRNIDGSDISREELIERIKYRLTGLFKANPQIPFLCWFNGNIKNMQEYIDFSGYYDGRIHLILLDKNTE